MSSRSFDSYVAGVTFNNSDGSARQAYIRKFVKAGMPATLKREPDNKHDPNAIAVWVTATFLFGLIREEIQIGYLPADLAQELAGPVSSGGRISATVSETEPFGEDGQIGVRLRITRSA